MVRRLWITIATGSIAAVVFFEGGLYFTRRAVHLWPELRLLSRALSHGGVMLALGAAAVLARRLRDHPSTASAFRGWALTAPLVALGRRSLPIYWMHLELTYGLGGQLLRRSLDPVGCALGAIVLCVVCAVLSRQLQIAWTRGAPRPYPVTQRFVSAPNPRA